MSKRIIFLDIDGVIVTGKRGWDQPDPECVEALNRVIAATEAEIVVSSCWRIGRSVIELRELLRKWGVNGAIIDRTGGMQEQRGYEISEWLLERDKHRGDVGGFVILDDGSDMGTFTHKLVKCDFRIGLTPELAEKAIELLAGRSGDSTEGGK